MADIEIKPKRSRRKRTPAPVAIPGTPTGMVSPGGFYRGQFLAGETADLQQVSPGLQDEIAMLRIAIRRCFASASEGEGADLEGWVRALSALGTASSRLAHLLGAQQTLAGGGEGGEFLAVLSSALADVRKEMGL